MTTGPKTDKRARIVRSLFIKNRNNFTSFKRNDRTFVSDMTKLTSL